jgi:signal transduction histidine kinase
VAQFGIAGLVALGVLASVASAVMHRIGTSEALHEARDLAQMQAQLLQPDINDALLRGDPQQMAVFDEHVRNRVLSGRVRRIKVWSADGRVVYADDAALIGRSYPLEEDQRSVLETGQMTSDVSNLTASENQLDRGIDNRLLEVYERVRTSSGQPALFEVYLRYDSVVAAQKRLWLAFSPALLIALVALWFLQLPVAWRLTSRLHASQRERDELHRRAMEASEAERRAIAADLHDGVVQTLAGSASRWPR